MSHPITLLLAAWGEVICGLVVTVNYYKCNYEAHQTITDLDVYNSSTAIEDLESDTCCVVGQKIVAHTHFFKTFLMWACFWHSLNIDNIITNF